MDITILDLEPIRLDAKELFPETRCICGKVTIPEGAVLLSESWDFDGVPSKTVAHRRASPGLARSCIYLDRHGLPDGEYVP